MDFGYIWIPFKNKNMILDKTHIPKFFHKRLNHPNIEALQEFGVLQDFLENLS
jgi:hypothetical protein